MVLIYRLRGDSTNTVLPYGAQNSVFLSTRSPSSTLTPLLVNDTHLLDFPVKYRAVQRGDTMHTRPSGERADLIHVNLTSIESLSMPENANSALERDHFYGAWPSLPT